MPPFDPSAFLTLADQLLDGLSGTATARSDSDQARVRCSVGRSYYAAYLTARQALQAQGRITPRGTHQDHQLVIEALGGPGSGLGQRLNRLRAKRNRADYNLDPKGFTLASGRHWIMTARDLIAEIRSLP